jgi:2-octaprenyl-6-methoxyphenol hydroxylase
LIHFAALYRPGAVGETGAMADSHASRGAGAAVSGADAVVIGGGPVGLVFARALASAGMSVAVVDREAPGAGPEAGSDGRVSAVAPGSRRVLEALGLWRAMAAAAQPVRDIRVTDGAAPAFLHLGHGETGPEPLGHVVENRVIRSVLAGAFAADPAMTMLAPARVAEIARERNGARVALADGRVIRAPLVVGADGRASPVRAAAGIGVAEWDYDQGAIVATIAHARRHEGVAEERFLPAGPFAVLPMTDDAEGRHRSSVVWTERAALVPALLALDARDFEAELGRRLGDHLGAVAAVGPRWSYPLGLTLADSYVAERLALIGDAAHAIHPIAGQGLNLGIRDAAALAEVVVDARRLGLDHGTTAALADYERWRRFDNVCLAAATDLLDRLFSTGFAPLRAARALGLAAVQRLGFARRLILREAMGIAGDLPRLVRGEPL